MHIYYNTAWYLRLSEHSDAVMMHSFYNTYDRASETIMLYAFRGPFHLRHCQVQSWSPSPRVPWSFRRSVATTLFVLRYRCRYRQSPEVPRAIWESDQRPDQNTMSGRHVLQVLEQQLSIKAVPVTELFTSQDVAYAKQSPAGLVASDQSTLQPKRCNAILLRL